jgi:hypothetical protein
MHRYFTENAETAHDESLSFSVHSVEFLSLLRY